MSKSPQAVDESSSSSRFTPIPSLDLGGPLVFPIPPGEIDLLIAREIILESLFKVRRLALSILEQHVATYVSTLCLTDSS
jgi:hypothetical protein